MSATPRTDKKSGYADGSGCWKYNSFGDYVEVEFARELEREVARLQMELDSSCNAEELRQVRAENAALREDKARLDWLEDNCACRGGGSGATYSFRTPADVEHGLLRAAIDAARKEDKP